jgi:hypothetical protein
MQPAPARGDRLMERTGVSDRRAEPAQDRLELLTRAMALAHHRLVALLHVAELALETLALPEERLVSGSQRHQHAL